MHARVVHCRGGPCLRQQSRLHLGRSAIGAHDLHRDLAMQGVVEGLPDEPHPAGPDGLDQLVAPLDDVAQAVTRGLVEVVGIVDLPLAGVEVVQART